MTQKQYTVTIAARQPAESGPHTVTEIGRLNGAFGLTFTDRLNRPSECFVSFIPEQQDEGVIAWLRTPAHEVWVYRDDTLVFAGPTVVRQAQTSDAGVVFSLQCRSRLHYLSRRMLDPSSDVVYRDVEQVEIAADLIRLVQAESYSDFGIDVSTVTPTGVVRDRSYLVDAFHYVGQRVEELAGVEHGFDFDLDYGTNQFRTYYPSKGVDLSNVVVLDQSNMVVPSASWLWGTEDYVSDAYASSSNPLGRILGTATNVGVRESFGRADVGASYQDVSEQGSIDEHAGRLASERSTVLYIPAPQVLVSGFESGSIETGDTIEVSYDYGLGTEVTLARVAAIVTTITDDGNETLGLEML